ncbi:MAG: hypothetical protein Kow00108_13010 [Calditrichia bacterium]
MYRPMIKIMIIFSLVFMQNLLGQIPNDQLIPALISDSLKAEGKVVIREKEKSFGILEQLINKRMVQINETLVISQLQIAIRYIPVRKFPFFKKRFIRRIYISAVVEDKSEKEPLQAFYEDVLNIPPESVENPSLPWSQGNMMNKHQTEPGWIEPFLLISGTLIVIFSFFYIRS